jgi:uncharacterized protein YciI
MMLRRLLLVCVVCQALAAQAPKPAGDAPQYEMTTYVLGLLRKGPNWGAGSKQESEEIQKGHMANIRRMAESGKLIVAGPLTDNGDIRGIFIFQAKSPDEVRTMAGDDPAIKAGRLILELHPWFAAAGLRVNDPKPPPR